MPPKDPAKLEAFKKSQSEKAKASWAKPETRAAHTAGSAEFYASRDGKTNIELYGEEKAAEISRKISDANKLVVHTPEWNSKVSEAQLGKTLSPEHCQHMSEARKDIPRGPRTPAWNAKMVESQRARLGKDRMSIRGQAWTKAVKERDNYTCQECGVTQAELTRTKKGMSSYLQAHHIKPREEYPEFQFDLDNGITYCSPCHSKVEAREKKKNLANVMNRVTLYVDDLITHYGITEGYTEEFNGELIPKVEQSLRDLHRILRTQKLLGYSY